jgi:AraC-like DNA-binding protein
VHCLWFLRGSGTGGIDTIVADGRLELVLHLGDPFAEVGADGVARAQDDALVAGQLTRPLLLRPGAKIDVVGIRFRTAGARAVLRSATPFTDQVVTMRDVSPALRDRLLVAASSAEAPHARAAAIAGVLAAVARADRLDPFAQRASAVLSHAPSTPIRKLSEDMCCSPRTLERRLQASTGVAPSLLRRVLRFRRAYPLLEAAGRGGWARAALEGGYHDQAHCLRDFRRFTGSTPSRHFGAAGLGDQFLAADAVASVQDGALAAR